MSKWKKVKIGDLLLRSKIPIDIEDTEEYKRVTIRIKHQGVSLRDIEIGTKIGTKKQFILKSGQFLMSKIDARYGAFGIAGDDVDDAIITGNFWAYDINSSLTTVEWINKYTNSPAFYDLCERASSGVTHRRYLNEQTFLNHELYIPSIDEQSQILFSNREKTLLLNNLENELNKQEKYVSQLKQAILQEAIAGQLTAEWRTENPMQKGNPDTDAAALLAKIKSEKQQLIADGKLKKEKPLAEIAIDEIPFSLPKNWKWVRISDLGHDWGQKKPDVDFTYIDVSAIDKEKGIISNDYQILNPENAPSRARKIVKKGTVIYATVRPYLLNIAIVDKDFEPEAIVSTAFAIIYPIANIESKYIYYYLRSITFIRYVESQMKGMAYPAINDSNFFKGLFPLPPLAE